MNPGFGGGKIPLAEPMKTKPGIGPGFVFIGSASGILHGGIIPEHKSSDSHHKTGGIISGGIISEHNVQNRTIKLAG